MGVNDGGETSFSGSTRAVRGGIFEQLHKKDEILYEALFWSEVRTAVDLRRRLPREDDSPDAVVNDEDRAANAASAGLGDVAEATRDAIGLGGVLLYLEIGRLRDL